jgi:hypothetical protein
MVALGIQIVQVRTDSFPYYGKMEYWLAAVPRNDAITAVLTTLPEGWAAKLAPESRDIRRHMMASGTVLKLHE